ITTILKHRHTVWEAFLLKLTNVCPYVCACMHHEASLKPPTKDIHEHMCKYTHTHTHRENMRRLRETTSSRLGSYHPEWDSPTQLHVHPHPTHTHTHTDADTQKHR